MNPAVYENLVKRIEGAREALTKVLRELEQQAGRESKLLEEAAFGDEFDEEVAPIQEKVVAAMARAIELLDEADGNMVEAQSKLEDITSY